MEAELLQMPDINQSSGQVLINPTCKTTNPSSNVKERSVKQVLFQPHSAQKWQENTPVQFLMRMESGLLVPLSGDNIMPCKLMTLQITIISIVLRQSLSSYQPWTNLANHC